MMFVTANIEFGMLGLRQVEFKTLRTVLAIHLSNMMFVMANIKMETAGSAPSGGQDSANSA
jgi:hypothetical protein